MSNTQIKPNSPLKRALSKERLWNSLKKCWKGYMATKRFGDVKKSREYAIKIIEIQSTLGLKTAEFPEFPELGTWVKPNKSKVRRKNNAI